MNRDLITFLVRGSHADRRWCGNDEQGHCRHHGAIPMLPDPVTIELYWRTDDSAPETYIGTYRLHLSALLENGFIKRDAKPKHVRVHFLNDGGVIKLAQGRRGPGLAVGTVNEIR